MKVIELEMNAIIGKVKTNVTELIKVMNSEDGSFKQKQRRNSGIKAAILERRVPELEKKIEGLTNRS